MTEHLIEFHARGSQGNLYVYENLKTGEVREEVKKTSWDTWIEKTKHPDIHMEMRD